MASSGAKCGATDPIACCSFDSPKKSCGNNRRHDGNGDESYKGSICKKPCRPSRNFLPTVQVSGVRFPYYPNDLETLTMRSKRCFDVSSAKIPFNSACDSVHKTEVSVHDNGYPGWTIPDLIACPICMDTIIEATMTNCGHTFCRHCVDEWMRRKSWCPICKTWIHTLTRSFGFDRFVDFFAPEAPVHIQNLLVSAREKRLRRQNHASSAFANTDLWTRMIAYLRSIWKSLQDFRFDLHNKGCVSLVGRKVEAARCTTRTTAQQVIACASVPHNPCLLLALGFLAGWVITMNTEIWDFTMHMINSAMSYWEQKNCHGKECRMKGIKRPGTKENQVHVLF